MKQLFHILIFTLALTFGSCQKDTFRGAVKYKKNKNQEKNDDYLESEASKAIEKNKKRNKKDKKKKIDKHQQSQQYEIDNAELANKKTKKKKKNTGQFHFY
jgi:hypothetical protein